MSPLGDSFPTHPGKLQHASIFEKTPKEFRRPENARDTQVEARTRLHKHQKPVFTAKQALDRARFLLLLQPNAGRHKCSSKRAGMSSLRQPNWKSSNSHQRLTTDQLKAEALSRPLRNRIIGKSAISSKESIGGTQEKES